MVTRRTVFSYVRLGGARYEDQGHTGRASNIQDPAEVIRWYQVHNALVLSQTEEVTDETLFC